MTAKSRKQTPTVNTPDTADVTPTTAPGTEGALPSDSAAHAVWAALEANPGAATMALSVAAQVSRATADKALKAFEEAGSVQRTPGSGSGSKRIPDTWEIIPVVAEEAEAVASEQPEEPPVEAIAEPEHGAAQDEPAEEIEQAAEAVQDEVLEIQTVPVDADADPVSRESQQALSDFYEVVLDAMRALEAGDNAEVLEQIEKIYVDAARVRRVVKAALTARKAESGVRTRPGQLRERVAAHLAQHPDTEFTPYELGRVLGHSAGAVAVALDRLTSTGAARLVCDRPRRFAHAA